MLCKTRRKDPTLSHNIGDFTTFNGSQSSAYAKEMLKTERYRFLFYAKKPPKIQQFTYVQRHWAKHKANIPKISYLLLFNFALFSPRLLSQVSAQFKSNIHIMKILLVRRRNIHFVNCVMTAVLTTCAHYRKKTWSTWLFSKTTASWGINIFST